MLKLCKVFLSNKVYCLGLHKSRVCFPWLFIWRGCKIFCQLEHEHSRSYCRITRLNKLLFLFVLRKVNMQCSLVPPFPCFLVPLFPCSPVTLFPRYPVSKWICGILPLFISESEIFHSDEETRYLSKWPWYLHLLCFRTLDIYFSSFLERSFSRTEMPFLCTDVRACISSKRSKIEIFF